VFTLSLHVPDSDNSLLDSWDIIAGFGTPGVSNPSYQVALNVQKEEKKRRNNTYLIGFIVLLGLTTIIGTRWRWRRRRVEA